jgi:dolichol-phosphate mannosyltransferase
MLKWLKQFSTIFRFITVGVIGLVINEGLLIILKEHTELSLPVASAIAIECAILCQFQLNDRWTFGTTTRKIPRIWIRFFSYQTACIVGLVINDAVLNLLVIFAGIDYRIANIIGIFIAFGWNYWINFNVTWKAHR